MIRTCALLAPLLACSIAMPAHADEASKNAKIERIFVAAKMDKMLDQMYSLIENQVKSQTFQQLMGAKMTPAQQQVFDEFESKVMKLVTSRLSWDQIKPIYVKLYADSFTESDIDGILAFYQSSAGQAMVAKTPQIMAAGNQAAQQRLMGIQTDLQSLMQEYIPKLKAAGSDTH